MALIAVTQVGLLPALMSWRRFACCHFCWATRRAPCWN